MTLENNFQSIIETNQEEMDIFYTKNSPLLLSVWRKMARSLNQRSRSLNLFSVSPIEESYKSIWEELRNERERLENESDLKAKEKAFDKARKKVIQLEVKLLKQQKEIGDLEEKRRREADKDKKHKIEEQIGKKKEEIEQIKQDLKLARVDLEASEKDVKKIDEQIHKAIAEKGKRLAAEKKLSSKVINDIAQDFIARTQICHEIEQPMGEMTVPRTLTELLDSSEPQKIFSLEIAFDRKGYPFMASILSDKDLLSELSLKMVNIFEYTLDKVHFISPENVWIKIKYIPDPSAGYYEQSYSKLLLKPTIVEFQTSLGLHFALANKYPQYTALIPSLPALPKCSTTAAEMPKKEISLPKAEKVYENITLTEQITDELKALGINVKDTSAIVIYPSGRAGNGWISIELEKIELIDPFAQLICNQKCPKGMQFRLSPKKRYFNSKKDRTFFGCFNILFASEENVPDSELQAFQRYVRRQIKMIDAKVSKIITDAIQFTET